MNQRALNRRPVNQRTRIALLTGLIVISLIVYLLGNGRVGLWDRDEPRYAETSRQMLQSGDWVVPHYLDRPRTAKPALIYWCQATAMAVFGDNEFAARFPSAVATTLLLIVLSFVLWRSLGGEMTVWTVFIFATSGMTILASKLCITDAVLLLWVTIGQLCIYNLYRGRSTWPVVLTLAVMIGLGNLTKGPVILGIQATTLLALGFFHLLERYWPAEKLHDPTPEIGVPSRHTIFKVLIAVVIVAGLVLPWVLMVNYRSSGFLWASLKLNVWDRMMTPLEQHAGPFGYYFLTVWLTFFPWSLLLPLTIGVGLHRRSDPRVRFALAAILGPWIMLECIKTKLPHYLLPVFPPLAFLTADALVRGIRGEIKNLQTLGFLIPAGIWAVLVALAASGPWLLIHAPFSMPIGAMTTLSIFGVLFGTAVFTAFLLRRVALAAIAMGIGTLCFIAILYTAYLPNAQYLRLSERVADVLKANHVTGPDQVIMLEYMEPSLAFAQGGTIREAGQIGFSRKFEPLMTPWLVINKTIWDKAPQSVRDDFEIKGQEFGLAYADRGKWETVLVLRKKS